MKIISSKSKKPQILKQYVQCITERETCPFQVRKGYEYVLDLKSVYIDSDGDAYGRIFNLNGECIGYMMLKHFSSSMI